MLTTCFSCHQPFPLNTTLEHFPISRRVAFDPERGRLWAICSACSRWTLAPFESRWEAVEELERLVQDDARLLGGTDRISLLAAGDVEIVRVGKATLREESWWRYGQELSRRRKRARGLIRRGKVFHAIGALLVAGIPYWGTGQWWLDAARYRRFGRDAWPGPLLCTVCGEATEGIRFEEAPALRLRPSEHHVLELGYTCPTCREGVLEIEGVAAEHTLRRILAHRNFAGGDEGSVYAAMDLVDRHDDPREALKAAASDGVVLRTLSDRGALALEIALNTDVERRLLSMELTALERRWKEEEEIAAIADDLLLR